MSISLDIFNRIDSFNKNAEKCAVLDIGAGNCWIINEFLINGYTDLTAIDSEPLSEISCFYNFKIAKNEVAINADKTCSLLDREMRIIENADHKLRSAINEFYWEEYTQYTESIEFFHGGKRLRNTNADFFTFSDPKKFNVILSRLVFHFYPPEDDITIINKLKKLSHENGLIYIEVNNTEKANTLKPNQMAFKNIVKEDDRIVGYLFDNTRLNSYKSQFELLDEGSEDVRTHLILRNNKST
jgi:SAM-dependent methyltransferase